MNEARDRSRACARHHAAPIGIAILLGVLGAGATATAAEPRRDPIPPPAPREAIELTLSAGYARAPRGYGGLASSSAGEGVASDFGLVIRSLRWSVGLIGQYAELGGGREALHAAKAGLGVSYHFLPDARLDPWIGASTGYRYAHGSGASSHGFEVAHMTAGADLRAASFVAAGPMVSFGLDAFPWPPAAADGVDRWYASMFAGVQGRFDLSPAIVGD